MTKKEKVAHVRKVERRCRGPLSDAGRKTVNELLERGDLDGARRADRANRAGCGYDVNELVIANLDKGGESLAAECPECGQTIRFTPPVWGD